MYLSLLNVIGVVNSAKTHFLCICLCEHKSLEYMFQEFQEFLFTAFDPSGSLLTHFLCKFELLGNNPQKYCIRDSSTVSTDIQSLQRMNPTDENDALMFHLATPQVEMCHFRL